MNATDPSSASAKSAAPAQSPRGVDVRICGEVTSGLLEAVERLVKELSRSSPPPGRAELEQIVAAESTKLFLAYLDGRIIGILTLVTFRTPTALRARIEDVVVDRMMRGMRVGELLTNAALDVARDMGARTADLTSRPSRPSAIRLYTRMGFEQRESNVYRLTL